ncbi:MAG: xanthine dehydrogenase family protein subunit M [Spirochaetaceae bacterium]|nr:MAG: xanthine dehydrogenase family protein subunit M [Spirochaetaceae bacterium]
MSSTRVISLDCQGSTPRSLEEALEALKEEGAQVLAGGTDLVNNIKINLARPRRLVYILGISDLGFISVNGGALSIGAAARLSAIEHDRQVISKFPALSEAINVIGGTQIRNMATLAGNICNASPGADTPPILLVLDAEVEICGANGSTGIQSNRLPLGGFFTGPKRTVLKQGQMVRSVSLTLPPKHSGAAFRRLARVSLDIAKINCAAYVERDGDRIRKARIALGSVAPTPVRAPTIENALEGRKYGLGLIRESAELVEEDIAPIDDVRSTAEYRGQIASLLVREALQEAWKRSGGKE